MWREKSPADLRLRERKSARRGLASTTRALRRHLLRIGLWPAYDFELQRAELTLSIGVDLMSWNRLIAGGQETAYGR